MTHHLAMMLMLLLQHCKLCPPTAHSVRMMTLHVDYSAHAHSLLFVSVHRRQLRIARARIFVRRCPHSFIIIAIAAKIYPFVLKEPFVPTLVLTPPLIVVGL